MIYRSYLDTPIGMLCISATEVELLSVYIPDGVELAHIPQTYENNLTRLAARQIRDYFDGRRREFHIRLRLDGTDFQRRVWNEVRRIPFGATDSYYDIACRISDPCAVRAVAATLSKNRFLILVPCHRVCTRNGVKAYSDEPLIMQRLRQLEREMPY